MTQPPQDIEAERRFQAGEAAHAAPVGKTAEDQVARYRHCRQWRLFPKEYQFRLLNRSGARTVCDFGCGTGEVACLLALLGYEVVGLDASPELVGLARRRAELDGVSGRVTFRVVDLCDPGSCAPDFDAVFVHAVLHHLDTDRALDTILALLKADGVVLIKEPVALSPLLRRLRERLPLARDISPNERQLDADDLAGIRTRLHVVVERYYMLFARLLRLFPESESGANRAFYTWLRLLDYGVLNHVPGCRRLAGMVVIEGRKAPGFGVSRVANAAREVSGLAVLASPRKVFVGNS